MAIDPFKTTQLEIGQIVNALSSDTIGNLILSDILNPLGVTLSQLINGLQAANISFDNTGTFYTNVTTVSEAFEFLNQFAYLSNLGRFIYVDPTIPDSKVVVGSIYNSLPVALTYVDSLIYNGYNSVNIYLMGSHQVQTVLDQTTDLGVYEFTYSNTWSPMVMRKNGIKLIGMGNPVIRFTNFTGTSLNRLSGFQIDTDGVNNNISVEVRDISFEFVNCQYTSAFKVLNAPINTTLKERSGLHIVNPTVSFYTGTNDNNRFIDVSPIGIGTLLTSNVLVDNLIIGDISGVTASTNDIQLVYVNHDPSTVVVVNSMTMGLGSVPNSADNTDPTNVTSFTCATILSGNLVLNNPILDEKFYWNGITFLNAVTKFIKCFNTSQVTVNNVGIVRNSHNTTVEMEGGITTIQDWISINDDASIQITGFDEVSSITVQSIPASAFPITSIGTTGTSGTPIDVKPIKSFWNSDEFAFGIGDKNELRLGLVTDPSAFINYDINHYGAPFWFDATTKMLKYFDGTNIVVVGSGGGNINHYTKLINTADFTIAYSGYQNTIVHNLDLSAISSFTITIMDNTTKKMVMPDDVIYIDANTITLVMADNSAISVTIIGT